MFSLELYYFISDYNKTEIQNLDKKINIIYRNYNKKTDLKTILDIKSGCRKYNKKFYISNNIKLALKLNLDGVYIPAFNRTFKMKYTTRKNFTILGSAHNLKEIKIKEKQGVNSIFLSPVFEVSKKKNFLGIYRFNILSKLTKKRVIALGGINKKNINKLKLLKCDGFGSISYIKNRNNEYRK